MDSSRFKRRTIQTKRQNKQIYAGDVVSRQVRTTAPREVVVKSSGGMPASAHSAQNVSDYQRKLPFRLSGQSPRSVAVAELAKGIVSLVSGQSALPAVPLTAESPQKLVRIDMGLPGDKGSKHQWGLIVHNRRWKTVRRWSFRTVAVLLVLVIGGGSLAFSQSYLKLHKVFKGGSRPVAALTKYVNPDQLKTEGDGRINILLLGRGGGDHDGPDLTDTMMLASIDPVNHTATLLSIPRDLWVTIPGSGAMKINAAWETGEFAYEHKVAPGSTDPLAIQAGFNTVDQTVEGVLGVTIDYNAIVDFQAFSQAVDTVNGITINVPTDLVDPTMAWQNKGNPLLAAAGIQTFNGNQALLYVRSRETTSDFARAQRQRAVLLAIEQKAQTLGTISNPLKLSGLLSAFSNNVSTDLSLSEASELYSDVSDISPSSVASIGLADAPNNYVTTGNLNGQSIDEPSAGLFNYAAIQSYVRGQLKDPYILKENATVMVLNGTSQAGLATTEAATLMNYGYNVIGEDNAPSTTPVSEVIDLSKGKDSYTKHYLEQRFNTAALTQLPNNQIQTNGADFVIILGSDETTSQ